MRVPISIESDDRTWEVPVTVRPVDEDTIERDLNRLRGVIWQIALTDPAEALRITNVVSRTVGHPI